MRKRKLTLKEKKQQYKTIAGYKAAKRKKNAEQLNEELKIKFTEAKTVYRYINGISISDNEVHRNFDKAFIKQGAESCQ